MPGGDAAMQSAADFGTAQASDLWKSDKKNARFGLKALISASAFYEALSFSC